MDNAVAIVEAYLYINGYFTVTEYPVIEAVEEGGYRMVTDLDVLALRFPGAGRLIPGKRGLETIFATDQKLACSTDHTEMIVAEVKEGRAEINQNAKDPIVLRTMLTRFGCCPASDVDQVVRSLLRTGETTTQAGHRIRLMAFGSIMPEKKTKGYKIILLKHVVRFLQEYLKEHWDILRHGQFKHPAFGFLVTLEKALYDGKIGYER
ncbi:hypothetical protein [Sulfurovum sp. TSL1]|uniref:hypothetical protein n=2 Tax=unclassified Sulfurovum TaxID=2646778 RepID=UPI001CC6B959|nr:hypothetical protein [Sulfurovum sp. TSL1]GIT99113.1 hypothetical protein TSL1_19340 [Sulfurovum sp. TSL1]GIU01578.1 hypothetical protein TSL6_20840 [Sulfurovum sp. TSL6]